MRKLFLALAAVAALAFAGQAGAASNATKTIKIFGYGFSPSSATVTEGDTVRWVNRDNASHQVLAAKGSFVSPILKPNQSYSFTFKVAGTYTYSDELSPKHTGEDRRQGAAAVGDARYLRADRHLRHAGDAERRRLEPCGQRAGDDLLQALPAAER